MYYALLEGRFSFDLIHENDITSEGLTNYQTLILPNIALLSDEQVKSVEAFVNRGGSLLATFETGLYDEFGNLRNDFALSEIFDTHLKPGYKKPFGQVFYAKLVDQHPILEDFKSIEQVPGGEYFVPVTTTAPHLLDIVPPFPNGIPEMVYPYPRKEIEEKKPVRDNPAIVVRQKGKSRLVYFPIDIDKNTWTRGSADLSKILQNAVRCITKDTLNISVEGEGYLEIFSWQTEPGFALHLINYNNPNMTRASVREFFPIGEQKISMLLPEGVKIREGRLLRSGKPLPLSQSGRKVDFIIPSIIDFEIAALFV
jgi:hypothetical protein